MVHQDLLSVPFVKISIKDLILDHERNFRRFKMVWIQGTVAKIIGDKEFTMSDCENLGHSVSITSNSTKPSAGQYIQVLGEVLEKAKIRAVKIVNIESSILREMWPLELEDFQRMNKAG